MNAHLAAAEAAIRAARTRYLEDVHKAHDKLRAAVIQDPSTLHDAKATFELANVKTAQIAVPNLEPALQPDGVEPTEIDLVAGGDQSMQYSNIDPPASVSEQPNETVAWKQADVPDDVAEQLDAEPKKGSRRKKDAK